jgi:hypothetical protein
VGGWLPILYVASTAAVLVAVVANLALPGLRLVALGAASNLAAIVANGGYMPADPDALAAAGMSATDGPTNSIVATNPALAPLTDIFAIPDWVPFANVFSIGDVLIGVGVAWAIARLTTTDGDRASVAPTAPSAPATPAAASDAAVRGGTSPD